jgi:hypothetical protein
MIMSGPVAIGAQSLPVEWDNGGSRDGAPRLHEP